MSSTILPAATVLVARSSECHGVEILLLKRNSKLKFAPSYWVFPGGRVDNGDRATLDSEEDVARKAAVRELKEETQLSIESNELIPFYHWTTPEGQPPRFGTWFFHTEMNSHAPVTIDNGEIVDYRWLTPQQAVNEHLQGLLPMLPPTLLSLYRIKKAHTYGDITTRYDRTGLIRVNPVMIRERGIFQLLYQGDAGYDHHDPSRTKSMHRLTIKDGSYKFEYENCSVPSILGMSSFSLQLTV